MADADIAYKHFRIWITETPKNTYARIDELRLYESVSRDAENIATPLLATATSIGNYSGSTGPGNVMSTTGYWESNSTLNPKWIVLSFATARPVRAFDMISKGDPTEYPIAFKLQGSNDNSVWTDLYSTTSNTINGALIGMYLDLSGTSKLDNGNKSEKVFVHKWASGDLVEVITPSFDGSWTCPLRYDDDVLVTHIGTSGYEPKSDGPIKPYSRQ